jgi:hypothetical protein
MSPFALLTSLCGARESGLLLALTSDNHQLRVGLAEGTIVHLVFAHRRGAQALEKLLQVTTRSASFIRTAAPEHHGDLPPHEAVLERLRAVMSAGTATPPTLNASAGAKPATLPTHRAAAAADDARRTAALAQLRQLLVDHVGPIGDFLIEQETARGVRSWPELIERLAAEISPASEAQVFREAALRILR